MKRSVLLSLVLCIPIILLGQQEKKAIDQPLSEEINALQTAANLVQYGYSESSPLALIEAARIIGTTPKQSFTFELAEDKAKVDNVTKDNVVSYDPEELLASAENLAGKDKTIKALIKNVRAEIKEYNNTRGAVGGAKYMEDVVSANSYNMYRVKFWAGELAEVIVIGDGDTDLDLYIYDANGNLIASDTDYLDACICRWTPAWTGDFIIKVVNLGNVYNRFAIATN